MADRRYDRAGSAQGAVHARDVVCGLAMLSPGRHWPADRRLRGRCDGRRADHAHVTAAIVVAARSGAACSAAAVPRAGHARAILLALLSVVQLAWRVAGWVRDARGVGGV